MSNPLASVSRILDKGNALIFSRSGSYTSGRAERAARGEPIRPIDADFEEDGEGEGELKVDEACD